MYILWLFDDMAVRFYGWLLVWVFTIDTVPWVFASAVIRSLADSLPWMLATLVVRSYGC